MSTTDALALLDLEGSERFVLPGGEDLVPATALPWDVLLRCIEDDVAFVKAVANGRRMRLADIARLRQFWVMQQGLVAGDDLNRLMWIVGTFPREVEVDLLQRVGVRLGDLWRERQWRLLLNLLDHLPRATWTHQAMVNHPDYAERVAESVARARIRLDDEPPSSPLVEWSPEVGALASVVDAVNGLRSTLIAVNMEGGKQPPKIDPYPRPRTLADSLVDKKERALRWAAHESLASRLVPDRRNAAEPEDA